MKDIKIIEGRLSAQGLKIAVAAARFNDFVVESLIDGAVDYLTRHGLEHKNLVLVRVPGAFELPLICQKLAKSGKYDGIVALGAVIRGATPHFEYVCAEATKGIASVSLQTGLPIGFGLLTTEDLDQAVERAGGKAGNKGADSAAAMLESIQVLKQI
jgi:6,7-dimethyl-8-ribityllumazine synthase